MKKRIRIPNEDKALIFGCLRKTIGDVLPQHEVYELCHAMMPLLCKHIAHDTDYKNTRVITLNQVQLGFWKLIQYKFGQLNNNDNNDKTEEQQHE